MSSSPPGTTERDLGRLRRSRRFAVLAVVVATAGIVVGTRSVGLIATYGDDGPIDRAAAIVDVHGVACGQPTRGVGVVVEDDRVLTNAHVVAGVDAIEVAGRTGELLAFDPNRDLALVAVTGLDRTGVELAQAVEGDEGTLIAIDATGRTVRHPFRIGRTIRATGEDIYRVDGAERRALEVSVEFAPGWSGAGLFDEQGRLVGSAFAESRRRPGIAYAVAASEIADFLASMGEERVDPGPCL